MKNKSVYFEKEKRIAIVAHDNKKPDLLEWAKEHRDVLLKHTICSTGTTGKLLEKELNLKINKLNSGPLGGDQQIGAKIAEGDIDILIFFWDPLEPQPHDPDIKALLRIAVVWDIPIACNHSSADFIFTSSLISERYKREVPDYNNYLEREV